MSQMQKRQARARARTITDVESSIQGLAVVAGERQRHMFQNLMDRHYFSLNIDILFKYAFNRLTKHRS